jgi:hypothetical protein
MTRFGVMKHLRSLEAAGLIATRKLGREKRHYLNPVPIRFIHDRWLSKYTSPSAAAEVHQTLIRTTPDRVWQALTDSALMRRLPFEGDILESDPPHRLVHTWVDARETSRLTWQTEPLSATITRLTLTAPPAVNVWSTILSGLKTFLETGEAL